VVKIISPTDGQHLCGTFSTWGTITPKDVKPTAELQDNAGNKVATGTLGTAVQPSIDWYFNFLTLPPPGRYTLVVEATNASGTGSDSKKIVFCTS
jgi:hypothetical protein